LCGPDRLVTSPLGTGEERSDHVVEPAERPGDTYGFAIMHVAASHRDLFGLLALRASLLKQAGGFDEMFRGWGYEDLELRLRLLLRCKAKPGRLPDDCARPIAHSYELRTAHQQSSLKHAHDTNRAIFNARLVSWGFDPGRLPGAARSLMRSR
jgi:hypothetical protein